MMNELICFLSKFFNIKKLRDIKSKKVSGSLNLL